MIIAPVKPHFMRTCWFIAYNIRLESLIPAMQELLCFPKFADFEISLFYHCIAGKINIKKFKRIFVI